MLIQYMCDPESNGEMWFYNLIKPKIKTIFDIGCRSDSIFTEFVGDVHYFDPMPEFINNLALQVTQNSKAVFNAFGLGNDDKELFYYPLYQSFYNRVASCYRSDEQNKITLKIRKASDYLEEHNIPSVDFVKIDTEGYELEVLKGFGSRLNDVRIVQFEYGGTYLDSKVKLSQIVQYLTDCGFGNFAYLTANGLSPLLNTDDHYRYSNIVCYRPGLF
jgi:FkbM family methyltransferase